MTNQEKQEIIAEVEKTVMENMKGKILREDTQRVLKMPREKWYGDKESRFNGNTTMQDAFGPYMAWEAWDHIRRLTCLVCGERYVRRLAGNPDAERICDEICQKVYELRTEITKGGEKECDLV